MTDRRIERTRAALGEAVVALAGEKAFADITITEIADRAAVGYATFFRHYRDKEALLEEVAAVLIDELLTLMMPALIDDDTRAASVALCQFVDRRRHICRALLAGGAGANVRRLALERAHALGKLDNTMRAPGVEASLVLDHAVGATLGLLAAWLESGGEIPPDAMGGLVDRLALRPVREALDPASSE